MKYTEILNISSSMTLELFERIKKDTQRRWYGVM